MDTKTFYVYAYLRGASSTSGERLTPYYIGMGQGNRAFVNHRNGGKGVYTPIDRSLIIIVETNLTKVGACAIERRLIRWYGRKDIATGILHNRTSGGETGDYHSGRTRSEETKQKMRAAQAGRVVSMATRAKQSATMKGRPGLIGPANGMFGKSISDEHKQALSIANAEKASWSAGLTKDTDERLMKLSSKMKIIMSGKGTGRKLSDETKKKLSVSKTGKKQSLERIEHRANAIRGKTRTKETKMLISLAAKNRIKLKCPHCGKEAQGSLFTRWHGNNCKMLSKSN